MDYARKIAKKDKQLKYNINHINNGKLNILTGVQYNTINRNINDLVHYDNEDPRLANWKKWLKIRCNQNTFYRSIINRPKEELLLNSSEKYRALAGMKNKMNIIAKTVGTDSDKICKIKPEFWKLPDCLLNKEKLDDSCNGGRRANLKNNQPVKIFTTLTKKDLKPQLTLMRTVEPILIQKEKELKSLKKVKHSWKNNEYLKEKIQETSPKMISLLLGNVSNDYNDNFYNDCKLEKLFIKGKKYMQSKTFSKFTKRSCVTTIDEIESEIELKKSNIPYTAIQNCNCTMTLKIDVTTNRKNFTLKPKKSNLTDKENLTSTLWNIIFTSNTKLQNSKHQHVITFENTGNKVIIYQWHKEIFSLGLEKTTAISPFFFNKNKGLILPGHIIYIPIWYKNSSESHSNFPQVRTEFWRLETIPVLCNSKLIFRMWGICQDNDCNCKSETLLKNGQSMHSVLMTEKNPDQLTVSQFLDCCMRDRVIIDTIHDILQNVHILICCHTIMKTLANCFEIEDSKLFDYLENENYDLENNQISSSFIEELDFDQEQNFIIKENENNEIFFNSIKYKLLEAIEEICEIVDSVKMLIY